MGRGSAGCIFIQTCRASWVESGLSADVGLDEKRIYPGSVHRHRRFRGPNRLLLGAGGHRKNVLQPQNSFPQTGGINSHDLQGRDGPVWYGLLAARQYALVQEPFRLTLELANAGQRFTSLDGCLGGRPVAILNMDFG